MREHLLRLVLARAQGVWAAPPGMHRSARADGSAPSTGGKGKRVDDGKSDGTLALTMRVDEVALKTLKAQARKVRARSAARPWWFRAGVRASAAARARVTAPAPALHEPPRWPIQEFGKYAQHAYSAFTHEGATGGKGASVVSIVDGTTLVCAYSFRAGNLAALMGGRGKKKSGGGGAARDEEEPEEEEGDDAAEDEE